MLLVLVLCGSAAYVLSQTGMVSYFETRFSYLKYINFLNAALNGLSVSALCLSLITTSKSRAVLIVVHGILAFVFVSVMLYQDYFHAMPHLNSVTQLLYVAYIGNQIISQLMGYREWFVLGLLMISLGASLHLLRWVRQGAVHPRLQSFMRWGYPLLVVLFVSKLVFVMVARPIHNTDNLDSIQAFKEYGYLPYYAHQLYHKLSRSRQAASWPGKIHPAPHALDIAAGNRGKNVIFLQMESLDKKLIDHVVDGDVVVPFLSGLARDNLFFTYYYAQHAGGGSSDTEISSLISLLPLKNNQGHMTLETGQVVSLCDVLKQEDYVCLGMHANTGAFFNRESGFLKMGFDIFLDQDDYTGDASGWDSRDADFLAQSVARLERLDQPFLAYLITMQGHGPFQNYDHGSAVFSSPSGIVQDYFNTMHDVDAAVAEFFTRLDVTGLYQNTIFFVFGDHESGLEFATLNDDDLRGPAAAMVDRVPLIIVNAGFDAREVTKAGSPVDLAPTVLDFLGLSEPEHWLGTSLLQGREGTVIINGSTPLLIRNSPGGIRYVFDVNQESRPYVAYSEQVLDP